MYPLHCDGHKLILKYIYFFHSMALSIIKGYKIL